MRRALLLIAPTIVVGMVAGVVSTAAHEGDPAFVFEQQHPTTIEPGQLEAIIQTTREPLASGQGSDAISVHCLAGHSGPKRNPWRCRVRYGSGHVIAYRVIVQLTGRFQGVDRTGVRVINGCCLQGGVAPSA